MKKLWIVIMLMALLITGCQEQPLKIGVVGTMTGANSDLSVSGRRGIEMAVSEINAQGGIDGREVELVIKDDQNNPETSNAMLLEFVKEDIDFVIGPYTSGMMMAIIDDVNANDILYIAPTVSADSLSNHDDNFVRVIASTKEQADIIVQDISMQGYEEIVVVIDERNKGFVNLLVENFNQQLLEKLKISADVITINPTDYDQMLAAIDQLKERKPEVVFTIFGGEHCAEFAQEMQVHNLNIQQYGPLWANTPELIYKGGTAVEGMKLVGAIDYEAPIGNYANFEESFFNRYGEVPTFSSMYSYEGLYALKSAFEASGDKSVESVKASLIDIQTFNGVQEDYSIDAYGDNVRPYLLFEIVDGKVKRLNYDEK